jgi:hypothetical protein
MPPLSDRQRCAVGRQPFQRLRLRLRLADVDRGVQKVAHTGTHDGACTRRVTLLPDRNVGFVILANGEADDARTVLTESTGQALHRARAGGARWPTMPMNSTARRAALPANSTPRRHLRPAAGRGRVRMRRWLGVYRDPWFGEVALMRPARQRRCASHRASRRCWPAWCIRVGERWFWWTGMDDSVDTEAWLDLRRDGRRGFADHGQGSIPEADFSYDYEDLAFKRTGTCP